MLTWGFEIHASRSYLWTFGRGVSELLSALEGYTGANDTTFPERGLITAFLPSRNTGIVFHGATPKRMIPKHTIRWNIAFVQEEDDFGIDISRNSALTARFATAFRPNNNLLHVGFDYSRRNADDDGTLRFLERPEANLAPQFVDTDAFPAESLQNGMWRALSSGGRFPSKANMSAPLSELRMLAIPNFTPSTFSEATS